MEWRLLKGDHQSCDGRYLARRVVFGLERAFVRFRLVPREIRAGAADVGRPRLFFPLRLRISLPERNTRSQKFYRIINEVPTALMILIVILVVVKPF